MGKVNPPPPPAGVFSGFGNPPATLGNLGDFYFNRSGGVGTNIWQKQQVSSSNVAFRASSTASGTSNGSSGAILTIPSAVQVGDIMVIGIVSAHGTNTGLTGWTLQSSQPTTSGYGQTDCYTKTASLSDTGGAVTVTAINNLSGFQTISMAAYSNAATINAVSGTTTTAATSLVSASVTPTISGTVVVQVWGAGTGGAASTITPPANSRVVVSAGTAASGAISDQNGPAANTSSGTVTANGSVASNWGEVTLAIAPPTAPGWVGIL